MKLSILLKILPTFLKNIYEMKIFENKILLSINILFVCSNVQFSYN
jgi:hypothetical protein